jgi:hypothetical protein
MQLRLVGANRAGAHRDGTTLYCLVLTPSNQTSETLVLFLANFLTSPLASERGLYTFFLTGFQVKGVALDLFNDVFLLHLALEAAQSVLERFTLLQPNFRQTDTPPDPSSRTE